MEYKDLKLHQKALYDRIEAFFSLTSVTIEDFYLVVSLLSDKYKQLHKRNMNKTIHKTKHI